MGAKVKQPVEGREKPVTHNPPGEGEIWAGPERLTNHFSNACQGAKKKKKPAVLQGVSRGLEKGKEGEL
jgi:hypothetical protein